MTAAPNKVRVPLECKVVAQADGSKVLAPYAEVGDKVRFYDNGGLLLDSKFFARRCEIADFEFGGFVAKREKASPFVFITTPDGSVLEFQHRRHVLWGCWYRLYPMEDPDFERAQARYGSYLGKLWYYLRELGLAR